MPDAPDSRSRPGPRPAARRFRSVRAAIALASDPAAHPPRNADDDFAVQAVADMDADVITIETSRSQMELLDAFADFKYPNEIGPGVYDIHSPRVPTVEEITTLLEKALTYIPLENLWVNPDCGLKTRHWEETEKALKNMVGAAEALRAEVGVTVK